MVGREKGRQEKGGRAELGGFVPQEEAVQVAEPATCSPHASHGPSRPGTSWAGARSSPPPAGGQGSGLGLMAPRLLPLGVAQAVLSGERGPCPPGGPAANPLFISLGVGFCTARPKLCAALHPPPQLCTPQDPPQAPGARKAGSSRLRGASTHVLRGGGAAREKKAPEMSAQMKGAGKCNLPTSRPL